MHDIQQTIRDYLDGERDPALPFNGDRQPVSEHTLRCFVGMIETGEAVAADFDAVRSGLAAEVLATLKRYQRKADHVSRSD